jgi:iron complex outermembrane receptor protein
MRYSVSSLVLAGTIMAAGTTLAQTRPDTASPDLSSTVQEVVVTAQKRTENVQRVPITVTPVTGHAIESLHVQDISQLTGMVPNVQINVAAADAPSAAISIRGVGSFNNPSPYIGTEVSTVVDGVVQATNLFGLTNLFDIERVEILSGPQGTLFGANTTGGVVNIITRQPTGKFDTYGDVGYGNYNQFVFNGAVDFPIIDGVLAGKVAFLHRSQNDFYTNLYNGENLGEINDNRVRAYLKWTPSANATVTLKADIDRNNPGSNVLYPASYPGEVFYTPGFLPAKFDVYSNVPNNNHIETNAYTLTADLQTAYGKITSITDFRHYTDNGSQDVTGIDCFCFQAWTHERGWQFSQEIRDVFHPRSNVEVLLGAYGLDWEDHSDFFTLTPAFTTTNFGRTKTDEHNENVSAFGQTYWDATDRLRVQAGLRVSWDRVYLDEAAYNYYQPAGETPTEGWNVFNGAILLPFTPGNLPDSGEKDWTNLGGKIGADYKLADDLMVYGYYARGFKSGGFNGRVTVQSDIGPFNPEFVNAFEIGFRSEWFDRRLLFNMSAFLNKWDNMQVTQSVYEGNPPVASSTILNAGKATSRGLEATLEVVPTTGLRISGNAGYLDAHYDTFLSGSGPACPPLTQTQPPGCSADYGGRELPFAPQWTTSITGSYTHTLAGGEASAMLQYTYTSKKWGNYTQSPSEALPPVGLLNANIAWTPAGGHWTLELWARNLTDARYLADALDVPPLFTEGVIGDPRQMGVDFKWNF